MSHPIDVAACAQRSSVQLGMCKDVDPSDGYTATSTCKITTYRAETLIESFLVPILGVDLAPVDEIRMPAV